jgi:metalloendopeptidase OMA1, mitochondrial
MLGSLPSYRRLMKSALRYLKPGTAWLECHEILAEICCDDDTVPASWPLRVWHNYLEEGATKMDRQRPIRIADKLASWMRDVGYVDVHERVDKIPMTSWPKDPFLKHIGRLWEANWLDGLSAFSYKIFGPEGLGWTQNEIEVFLVDVRKCIKDRNAHAYQKIYVVYGRRPSEEEERMIKESSTVTASDARAANTATPKQEGVKMSPRRDISDGTPVLAASSTTCSDCDREE